MDDFRSLFILAIIGAISGMSSTAWQIWKEYDSWKLNKRLLTQSVKAAENANAKADAEQDNIVVGSALAVVEQLRKRVDEVSAENVNLRKDNELLKEQLNIISDGFAKRIEKVENQNKVLTQLNYELTMAVKRLTAQVISLGAKPVIDPKLGTAGENISE